MTQALTSSEPLLVANKLISWRGETCVLDEVSVTVGAGDVVHVAGPNGSGKTTLLRTLAGLAMADEGYVHWRGASLERARGDFQAELLYLGHKPGISGVLTPRENLSVYLKLRIDSPNLNDLDEAIQALGLEERLDLPCRWLSAGQQRRVALARLVLEPATLWILDEPLSALDVNGVAWVVAQIEQHVHAGGCVVYTTHQAMPFNRVSPVRFNLSEAVLAL